MRAARWLLAGLACASLGAALALMLAPLSLVYTSVCDDTECRVVPCEQPTSR